MTRRSLALGASLFAIVASSASSRADDKADCLAAHEQGQALRLDGKLQAARVRLRACAVAACPARVRADCKEIAATADAEQPTIVIDAKDVHGARVPDVAVVIDGKRVTESADGPIEIDPGDHMLRFETKDGRSIDRPLKIMQGEKDRRIVVELPAMPAAPPAASSATPPPPPQPSASASSAPPPPPQPPPSRPVPMAAYVLGGVAVVGAASFTYFGLSGKSKQRDLEKCANGCPHDDVTAMYRQYLFADVSLGIGAVALGVATYLFLTRPATREGSALWIDVRAITGGGTAGVGGKF